MFDVFYTGPKPELFPFEKEAASLEQARQLARTEHFWYIDGNNDYSNFNFDYKPVPWEAHYTHAWPSQWQDSGETYLAPTASKDIEWHWHDKSECVPRRLAAQVFYMDFMNPESETQLSNLKHRISNIKSTRYVDSHLNVFKRIMNLAETEYVWVISSICDYTEFDFSWHPNQWQKEMIHCFSNHRTDEQRGDTFYIHVESFKKQMVELELLDWFNVINYIPSTDIIRWPTPICYYESDNLIQAVKDYEFKTPFVVFTNTKLVNQYRVSTCVWTQKDRIIEPLSQSRATAIVPRDIKVHLKSQIYDYPFINTERVWNYYVDVPQDIIFISYDETNADANWEKLKEKIPRAKRLHGVEGMDNALKRAAEMSSTPWYYAVFAKTALDPEFDFSYQPDYFQAPKHYIFYAHNPMNGLKYGHMGVVMYNCNIVKNMTEFGIDYTMSGEHEVVPIVSAVAEFNTTPYQTWRTAFREAAKLSQFEDESPNVETSYRLKVWTTKATGDYAEWCLAGAQDGVRFYQEYKNNKAQLKNAFNWAWLRQHFESLHGSQP